MNRYTNQNNRQQIDFDEARSPRREASHMRGLRDEDWTDDEFTTPDGYRRHASDPYADQYDNQYADQYDNQYADRQQFRRQQFRRQQPDRYSDDGAYRYTDDTDRYDNRDMRPEKKPASFVARHPVLMNLLYIIIAAVFFGWVAMLFLDYWTFHGQERVVPDAKNQSAPVAISNIRSAGLKAVINDSIFDSYAAPGTVVEQSPVPGAKIKKGGSVYLTIVSFSPKMVTVPDFYNVSERQARSLFEGLGLPPVTTQTVASEYEGLVLGARYNG
ncbi:MAG: PASTA domain-containing protein, partial [Muribaculaceae bacterium]|nr:PASTA domain-containing protein [Muribaculaceae bacterium]